MQLLECSLAVHKIEIDEVRKDEIDKTITIET